MQSFHSFQSAAEVKHYLKERGIQTKVTVRGDRTIGSLWFSVLPEYDCFLITSTRHYGDETGGKLKPKDRWELLAASLIPGWYINLVIRRAFGRSLGRAISVVDLIRVEPMQPWGVLGPDDIFRRLSAADIRYYSSDRGRTAATYQKISDVLRNTNTMLG